jgi:hypothetical protein
MSAFHRVAAPVAGLIVGIAGFLLITPAGGDDSDCGWDAISLEPDPRN